MSNRPKEAGPPAPAAADQQDHRKDCTTDSQTRSGRYSSAVTSEDSKILQRQHPEGVDRAALVFAGVAAATTLISGSGAWTQVSSLAGSAILLILVAFHSPAPSRWLLRWIAYHLAFGAVFALGFMSTFALVCQADTGITDPRSADAVGRVGWRMLLRQARMGLLRFRSAA